MKKKIALVSGSLLIIIVAVLVFNSDWFSRIPYHATLYSEREEINEMVRPAFLDDNKVYGAYYVNPACLEDSDEYISEYYQDKESPKTRTFLIKDKETYKEIFYDDALNVNFEKEMLVLHIFTKHHPRGYNLKEIRVQDDTLEIDIKVDSSRRADAVRPGQSFVVIKMKKLDVSNVEVFRL